MQATMDGRQLATVHSRVGRMVQYHPAALAANAIPVDQWVEQHRARFEQLQPPDLLPVNNVVKGVFRCNFVLERVCHELEDMRPKFNRKRFPAAKFRMREHKTTVMLFARGNFMCVGARHYNAAIYCVLYLKARLVVAGGYPLIADEYSVVDDKTARSLAGQTDPANGRPVYEMFDEDEHNRKFQAAQREYQERVCRSRAGRRGEIVVQPRQRLMEAFSNSAFRDINRVNVVGSTVFSYEGTSTPIKVDLDLMQYFFSDIVSRPPSFPGLCIRSPALAPIRLLVFATGRVIVTGGQTHQELENALRYTHALIRMCSEKASRDFKAYYGANNPSVLEDKERMIAEAKRVSNTVRTKKRPLASRPDVTIDDLCDDETGVGDEEDFVVHAMVGGNGDGDEQDVDLYNDEDLLFSEDDDEDEGFGAEGADVFVAGDDDGGAEPRAKRVK